MSTLQQLTLTLEHQTLYIELLQEIEPGAPSGNQRVLATFETSGLEFLFPHPQLRPSYTSGVDVDLLMEPTRDFPGVIAPKVPGRFKNSGSCHDFQISRYLVFCTDRGIDEDSHGGDEEPSSGAAP